MTYENLEAKFPNLQKYVRVCEITAEAWMTEMLEEVSNPGGLNSQLAMHARFCFEVITEAEGWLEPLTIEAFISESVVLSTEYVSTVIQEAKLWEKLDYFFEEYPEEKLPIPIRNYEKYVRFAIQA